MKDSTASGGGPRRSYPQPSPFGSQSIKYADMKEWFVYIVRNSANILYTGIAKDTARRLAEHNNGTGAKFTRGRGPWIIAHTEGPFDHGDALRREMEIKKDRSLKRQFKTQ